MKRDWDVIRQILLGVEALDSAAKSFDTATMDRVTPAVAAYNAELLVTAGLVNGGCPQDTGDPWCHIETLTWEGHELLDRIRRDTIWHQVKREAVRRGLDLTFDVVRKLAQQIIDGL